MSPERWTQVRDIFAAAIALDPDERTAYLERASGGDPALRAEVESLIASHLLAPDFMAQPAAALMAGATSEERRAGRIGAYELLERIGHGGMGEVYRARRADAQFERDVAIKFMYAGYRSELALRRFKAERQILAELDHPNIAGLLDGGVTDDGAPYLVMELLHGLPIDEYCASHNLSIHQRLGVFLDVCAAVSYAHQHLVVHRDLKPANILVTDDGIVKLLDFGIAKLLQEGSEGVPANETVTLLTALTPAYSSPEQLLGSSITTASDVYSLGVVLFRLLTGRSPYRMPIASTRDAIREVIETEAPRPSVIAAEGAATKHGVQLPDRELDDIVLLSMRKEPEQRYATAQQLADDIRRYLVGLPVLAHADQVSYRARKFVRRHRLEFAAAVVVVLAMAAGTVISIREAVIARQAQARAERNFARTRTLANALMFDVHDAIVDLPGSTAARRVVVKNALQYLGELSAERTDDSQLIYELAMAYRKVGDIQGGYGTQNEGRTDGAVQSLGRSVDLMEKAIAARPNDLDWRSQLASNLRALATAQLNAGDLDAAADLSSRAVEVATQAANADRNNPKRRRFVAAAMADLCAVLTNKGAYNRAVSVCQASIDEQQRVVQMQPDSLKDQRNLAIMYSRASANIYTGLESESSGLPPIQTAVGLSRQALAMLTRLSQVNPDNEQLRRDVIAIRGDLANALRRTGDSAAAMVEHDLAIEGERKILARDPANVVARTNLATLLGTRAEDCLILRRPDAAVADLMEAMSLLHSLSTEQATTQSSNTLADVYLGLGNAYQALAKMRTAHSSVQRWREAERFYGLCIGLDGKLKAKDPALGINATELDQARNGLAAARAVLAHNR